MTDVWKSWLAEQAERRQEQDLERPRCRPQGGLLSFSDNDYLGLSRHPMVIEAAQASLTRDGLGLRSSALVVGRGDEHEALEIELAQAKNTEAALLFPSGFAANLAWLSCLADADTTIFSDALNHASIVDGCRLAKERGAKVSVFAHNDLKQLSDLLAACTTKRAVVVIESVFSMDGDLGDLAGLVALRQRYGFLLVVDEAHALGVIGPGASGLSGALRVEGSVDLQVGTLSKALGCQGGFVAGSTAFIEELWHRGRSQVFSTALPAPIVAAARAALRLAQEDLSLRGELDARRQELSTLLDVEIQAAICPIVVGSAAAAVALSAALKAKGILVPAIRPPTVPLGRARLRISLSARHGAADLLHLVDALKRLQAPVSFECERQDDR